MNLIKKTSSKVFISGFVIGVLMLVLPLVITLLTEGPMQSFPRALGFFPSVIIVILIATPLDAPFLALFIHGLFVALVFLVAYRLYRLWKWSLIVLILLYIGSVVFFSQWLGFDLVNGFNMFPSSSY